MPGKPQLFSVLMSVYAGESPEAFQQCLESLAAQTLPATEILIVKDGPLGDALEAVLRGFAGKLPIRTLQQERSLGLGAALRRGIQLCRHEFVARMDSDDLCVSRRFQVQMQFLETHPEIDALGGAILEFHQRPDEAGILRLVPSAHESIRTFARRRNPMNHPTVLFRKSAVLAAGNYRPRIGFEDYDLWVRMLHRGARFHNLEEVLIFSRCGNGLQNRRGGLAYAKREASLFWSFRRIGFMTTRAALLNIACRVPARLVPARMRSYLYRFFLRHRAAALHALDRHESAPFPVSPVRASVRQDASIAK